MFDQISIIGCGLIGSSIFKGLKKVGSIKKIITYDNDKSVNEIIKKDKLSDEIFKSAGDAVKNSDLIIIATPISSFENVLNSIKDNLKTGSILTDTCSVKTGVSKIFEKMNLKNSVCIPGHPVAGIENSGPKAGFADLFKNRWTILTPSKSTDENTVQKVSISSNDIVTHPLDSPRNLRLQAQIQGWSFPYLFDENQNFAKKLKAACTPDFYLFSNEGDGNFLLYYHGQLDDSRPGNNIPLSGNDLRSAVEDLNQDNSYPSNQIPSLGCNIKWTPGKEPSWFK